MPDVDVTTPSLDFGDGSDFGSGGESFGPGHGDAFMDLPPPLPKRCGKEDRLARLREKGGSPECDEAVMKSLRRLKQTQNPDGSWTSDHPVAMTGFARLAYLGDCETPLSDEFGDPVLRAITYLVNVGLKNDYRLTSKDPGSIQWVYDHGIATCALAESYTFCKSLHISVPDLDTAMERADGHIMEGQSAVGGWLYKFAPGNRGDNAVGYWQIQSLKACKHTGAC